MSVKFSLGQRVFDTETEQWCKVEVIHNGTLVVRYESSDPGLGEFLALSEDFAIAEERFKTEEECQTPV